MPQSNRTRTLRCFCWRSFAAVLKCAQSTDSSLASEKLRVEILWPALGIGTIVGLVFFTLANHWQKILRQHLMMMHALAERVRNLEEVNDPQFQRRLAESSPMPLEQVLNFTFRLNDRFWRCTLGLSDPDLEVMHTKMSFVGSVKLERWRSHIAATVVEVLPANPSAQWRKRSLDFYPGEHTHKALTLWELPVCLIGGAAGRPHSIELLLRESAIELYAKLRERGSPGTDHTGCRQGITLFSVPLDPGRLLEFRSPAPMIGLNGEQEDSEWNECDAEIRWLTFYSAANDAIGYEWHLCVRDLARKADWEHWKTLNPVQRRGEPNR